MSDILKKKILVVDDFPTMRRIIKKLLGEIGFTDIEEAGDGTEALELIGQHEFGLVISDWNMQPMTGLDLLTRVRNNPKTCDLPFIMVTAETKPDNVLAAKQHGVNNYIAKPFDAATLRKKVETVLGALG
jgi:two-component system, chemotaxis family, chemotaxis protein CheY